MKIHSVDCIGIWAPIMLRDLSIDQAVDQLFERIRATCIDEPTQNLLIVCSLVWESFFLPHPKKYDFIIRQCSQRFNDLYSVKLVFVVDSSYKLRWNSALNNVIYIDYHKLRLRYARQLKEQQFSNSWNCHANQWLLLTGKTIKAHRTRLIWKLEQADLLKNCHWSFWVWENRFHYLFEHFPELSSDEILSFVERNTRLPDDLAVRSDMVVSSGTKWAPHLYNNKLFNVVSETSFEKNNNDMIISEKTWKAIANSLPFIMVAPPGTCGRLRDQGYHTFEEFCKHPMYDSEQDSERRLDMIVENIEHWTHTLDQHADRIMQQVSHNRTLFWSQVDKEIVKISQIDLQHDWFEIVDFRES